MQKNRLTSKEIFAPDWTSARAKSRFGIGNGTRGGGGASRGIRTPPAGSPSILDQVVRNVAETHHG
jgi:hypothetical protein